MNDQCLHAIKLVDTQSNQYCSQKTYISKINEKKISALLFIIVAPFPWVNDGSYDKEIDIFTFFGSRRIFGGSNPNMMSIKMMISEVHIVELDKMKRANNTVIWSRFMHELMRNCKLSSIVVWGDKAKAYYEGDILHIQLYRWEHIEDLEENTPRKHHCSIKWQAEIMIISLKLYTLVFSGISIVKRK